MAIKVGPNAYAAFDQFTRKGLPPYIASALVGNMLQESGTRRDGFFDLNPVAVGDNGNSKYSVQWNGPRRRAYDAWAAERGLDPADVKTQADYVLHEFGTSERKAFEAILAAGEDPAEIARVATAKFWRPGDPRTENRMRYARSVFEQFAQNTTQANDASPATPDAPAATTPAAPDLDSVINEAIRARLGKAVEAPGAPDVDAAIDAAIKERLGRGIMPADAPLSDEEFRKRQQNEATRLGVQVDPKTGIRYRTPEEEAEAQKRFWAAAQDDMVRDYPISSRVVTAAKGVPFAGEYVDDVASTLYGPEAGRNVRFAQDAMESTRPIQSTALQLGGGLLATAPAAIAAAPTMAAALGTGLGTQTVRALGLGLVGGGIEGFISGLGEDEASLDNLDRAQQRAFVSALVGGTLSAVTPTASVAARKGWLALKGWMASRPEAKTSALAKLLGVSPVAAERIRKAIEADDFRDAAEKLAKLGDTAMLADAGPATRDALDAALRMPNIPAEVQNTLKGRLRVASRSLDDVLNRTLGTPTGVKNAIRELMQSTSHERLKAYEAAYAKTVPFDGEGGIKDIWARVPDSMKREASGLERMEFGPDASTGTEIPFPDLVAPRRRPRVPGEDDVAAEARENLAEADSFFLAYREMSAEAARMQRKPLAAWVIRQGGIDPDSDLAKELYARDITPRSLPGLFRRGGLKSLDGIDPATLDVDLARYGLARDDAGYVDQQALQAALAEEFAGRVIRSSEQEKLLSDIAEMERLIPDMERLRDEARVSIPEVPFPGDDVTPAPPTVRQIDLVARQLFDAAESARRNGELNRSRILRGLHDDLLEATDAAVPEFAQARAVAAPVIKERAAIELGRKVLSRRMTREDVALEVGRMSEPEKRRLAQGIRFELDETLANVTQQMGDPGADIPELIKLWRTLTSRAAQDKMTIVLGPARARLLSKELERATAALELRAALAINSRTAGRLADQELYKEAGVSVLGDTIASPASAYTRIVSSLVGNSPEAVRARQQGFAAEVARALSLVRGKDAENAIDLMRRVSEGMPLRQDQAEFVARTLIGGLGFSAYQQGVPAVSETLLPQQRAQ